MAGNHTTESNLFLIFILILPLLHSQQKITDVNESDSAEGGAVNLTKRQKEVLSFIKEDRSVSYRDLAEKLGINASAAQKHLNVLKNKGVIERIGGTSEFWKILVDL